MKALAFSLLIAFFGVNFVAVKNLYGDRLDAISPIQRVLLIPPLGLLLWAGLWFAAWRDRRNER